MLLILNSCLILFMGSRYGATAGDPVPEYAYSREADAWLRLHTAPAVYWDANAICRREGGVLASPTTDAMADAMRSAMADHNLDQAGVFAGIAGQANGDKSQSIFNNTSLEWAAGERQNATEERCLALTGAGALADVSCARAHPYICRRKSAKNCGAYSNGYEWNPFTGSCYKFHRIALPWRPALSTCHAEGGMLAVINSPTESSVLREIYNRNPETMITGTEDRRHALVGFRKYEDGEWATIYGDTLAEAGFQYWSTGEPNNAGGVEYCGSIFLDGLFNDISCTKPYPYICEITPNYE